GVLNRFSFSSSFTHSVPHYPRKCQLAFGSPLAFPGLQSLGTELIHASHLRDTLSGVDLPHHSYLQFTGILLSGHQHGSPPFNVAGPLISCLTFGVHSTNAVPSPAPHPGWNRKTGQASLLMQVGP